MPNASASVRAAAKRIHSRCDDAQGLGFGPRSGETHGDQVEQVVWRRARPLHDLLFASIMLGCVWFCMDTPGRVGNSEP